MGQVVVEVGGHKYNLGLVTQRSPSPSFALTLNTPAHAYLLKGNEYLSPNICPQQIIQLQVITLQPRSAIFRI